MWLLSYLVLGLISPVFTYPSAKNYKLFNQPPTVRLTAQNFAQQLNSSPNPWLIVVYSESSESCKRYSKMVWPTLAQVIGEDKVWEGPPIFGKNRVAAIEKGEGLFATHEYDFPSIKIFPPNSNGVPLSKKIDPYNIDAMAKILITIHAISQHQVSPKTSQEWTTRIDELLALIDGKDELVVVETYTEIITTTRVENPFYIFRGLIGLILLFLLCCKWIVKCGQMCAPEDKGCEEPVRIFHIDPGYSYGHPQPQTRSEAIPLPPP